MISDVAQDIIEVDYSSWSLGKTSLDRLWLLVIVRQLPSIQEEEAALPSKKELS